MCRSEVPQVKLVSVMKLIGQSIKAAQRGECTSRQLANAAGVLLSAKGVVHINPLYTRLLSRALGTACWDAPITESNREFALEDLLYWQANRKDIAGKSWVRREKIFQVAGDVSETGFAGHCLLFPEPITQAFTNEDLQLMPSKELSSVLRETVNVRVCIASALCRAAAQLSGGLLVYVGDNQGSVYCLNCMKDSVRILNELPPRLRSMPHRGLTLSPVAHYCITSRTATSDALCASRTTANHQAHS